MSQEEQDPKIEPENNERDSKKELTYFILSL